MTALAILFVLTHASHCTAAADNSFETQVLRELRSRNAAAADTFERANEARGAEDHRRAAGLFRSVTVMVPDFSHAWRREGYELLDLGLRPEAITCMRTALGLERSAWNLLGLATALSTRIEHKEPTESEIGEAVSLLHEAESMTESPEIARLGCELALRTLDAEWLGIEAKRYLRLAPSSPWAHFFGAIHLDMVGDRKAARADMERARALGLPAPAYRYLEEKLKGPSPSSRLAQSRVIRGVWIAGFLVFLVLGSILHTRTGAGTYSGGEAQAGRDGTLEARPPDPVRAGRSSMGLLVLAGLTVLSLLPFSGKAFHIDDPLFVWAAKQIQAKPMDPYGFRVNWYDIAMPMSDVTKNPPLTSYYIAGVAAATGIRERPIHIAFLAQAVLVILGTYLLASRLCRRPLLAALCALFTPVFLVSSSSVMSDTLMLAFWMASVYMWVTGLTRGSWIRLVISSLCVALSALSKYYGMCLIPLLLVYSIAAKRRVTKESAFLLIPVVILGAYQLATHHLYGRGLLADAASYATTYQPMSAESFPERLLVGASFTGGCFGLAWLLAFYPWKRRAVVLVAGIGLAVSAIAVAAWKLGGHPIGQSGGNPWAVSAHLGFFVAGGATILFLAARALLRERDPDSLLLGLWTLGTFGFAVLVNWSTNGRSILPMVPAVGILIARRIDEARGAPRSRELFVILGAAALLAIGVTNADLLQANSARRAASEIDGSYGQRPGSHWFSGHWGLQYYMEARGWKPIDRGALAFSSGDILVVPKYNTNVLRLGPDVSRSIDTLAVPVGGSIATVRPDMGASFYADVLGPLPFAFGKVTPEPYEIQEVAPPQ